MCKRIEKKWIKGTSSAALPITDFSVRNEKEKEKFDKKMEKERGKIEKDIEKLDKDREKKDKGTLDQTLEMTVQKKGKRR
jgi:hypothetical protein